MKTASLNIGDDSKSVSLIGNVTNSHGGLITSNTSLIINTHSLLGSSSDDGGLDTCSFYSGPSDAVIAAFGETCGEVAYNSAESCGSIAYNGAESCGSIACSVSTSSSSDCGGSYSCCC